MTIEPKRNLRLRQLVFYFLRLGYTGFGGPVALVGYMQRNLVEERNWISEEEYKEGLTLAQLAPGPVAVQLCIYLGFIRFGLTGATLCGLAFIIPSFLIVVALGAAYKLFNGFTWVQSVFRCVGGAVIGIIIVSSNRLTIKSIGKLNMDSFRSKWMLWLIYAASFAASVILHKVSLLLAIAAGLTYMFIKSPVSFGKGNSIKSVLLLSGIGFWEFEPNKLRDIGWFFFKAGAFMFGSGLAIIPYMHGAVTDYHWIDENTFRDAIAMAMITPGPLLITVAFIGYLVGGFPGACVAAIAIFLPCYLITIIVAPYFRRNAQNPWVKTFVEGITASIVGALTASVVVIATNTLTQNHKVTLDIPAALIAAVSLVLLIVFKKLQEPYIILAAAAVGLILNYFA